MKTPQLLTQPMVTSAVVAAALGMTSDGVLKLAKRDKSFPQPLIIGGGRRPRRRWLLAEIQAYLNGLRRAPRAK